MNCDRIAIEIKLKVTTMITDRTVFFLEERVIHKIFSLEYVTQTLQNEDSCVCLSIVLNYNFNSFSEPLTPLGGPTDIVSRGSKVQSGVLCMSIIFKSSCTDFLNSQFSKFFFVRSSRYFAT